MTSLLHQFFLYKKEWILYVSSFYIKLSMYVFLYFQKNPSTFIIEVAYYFDLLKRNLLDVKSCSEYSTTIAFIFVVHISQCACLVFCNKIYKKEEQHQFSKQIFCYCSYFVVLKIWMHSITDHNIQTNCLKRLEFVHGLMIL